MGKRRIQSGTDKPSITDKASGFSDSRRSRKRRRAIK
jgi:hypothetical protein